MRSASVSNLPAEAERRHISSRLSAIFAPPLYRPARPQQLCNFLSITITAYPDRNRPNSLDLKH